MQQTNSSTPLSPAPPPKRPQAFQATPLNSVLMRLESWHGKLQLSKRRGVWNDAKTNQESQTSHKDPNNTEQHFWTPEAKDNKKRNEQNYIHKCYSNLSTKTGCSKKNSSN